MTGRDTAEARFRALVEHSSTAIVLLDRAGTVLYTSQPTPSILGYAAGDNVGEIHEVVLGSDGRAEGLIIDVGGFLGINEKPVLVKWSDVTIQSDSSGNVVVATSMDKNQLEQLPEYRL